MNILISTNVFHTPQFSRIFEFLELFQEYKIGVEIFPLWHEYGFEEVLKGAVSKLSGVPVSFHGPYFHTEHSAKKGTLEYDKSMESFKKTLYYANELKSSYVVYHHNNCVVSAKNKEAMKEASVENLLEINCLAKKEETKVVVENAGVLDRENMMFNETEFIQICSSISNDVLIDIGHAHCNGWKLDRLMETLKNKTVAYHIHNNYGFKDEHRRIFDGTLDFKKFLSNFEKMTPKADLVIEYSDLLCDDKEGIQNDIRYLLDYFKY